MTRRSRTFDATPFVSPLIRIERDIDRPRQSLTRSRRRNRRLMQLEGVGLRPACHRFSRQGPKSVHGILRGMTDIYQIAIAILPNLSRLLLKGPSRIASV